MIKKILTLTILIASNLILMGQSCTPDNNINTAGYYPAELDSAQEMSAYNMTMQVYSNRDTMVDNPFGSGQVAATIDSILVEGVTGMPPGLNYICNPSDCRFVSLKTHCINIYGTPTQGSAGSYPLTINIRAKVTVNGSFKTSVTEEITNFAIIVKDDDISALSRIKTTDAIKVYPNPSQNALNIENLRASAGMIHIYAADGREVAKYTLEHKKTLKIDNSNWKTGIYTIKLTYADGIISQTQVTKI